MKSKQFIKAAAGIITASALLFLGQNKGIFNTQITYALDLTKEEAQQAGIQYTVNDYPCRSYIVPDGYEFDKKEVYIDGCSNDVSSLAIPDTIEGYPVRRIEKEAFVKNKSLTEVHIPDGVTSVGCNAFSEKIPSLVDGWLIRNDSEYMGYSDDVTFEIKEGVKGIAEASPDSANSSGCWYIRFPSTMKYIGKCEFNNYSNLRTVSIPESVESIDISAFGTCLSLKSVYIYNPDCRIYCSGNIGSHTFYPGVTYYGYEDSTLQEYCKNNSSFFVIENTPEKLYEELINNIKDLRNMSGIILLCSEKTGNKNPVNHLNVFDIIRQKQKILYNQQ